MLYTRMAEYCKKSGMTLEEYEAYRANIDAQAKDIFEKKVLAVPSGTGMFYPVDELLSEVQDEQARLFVIQSLKRLHVEFQDNTTIWRY